MKQISFIAVLYLAYVFIIISCGEVRLKRFTPAKYLNNVPVSHGKYVKDSIQIIDTLRYYLNNHKGFFQSKEYFDSTQLIIDTIIYNERLNKFIVFVMTKNPTYRQLYPDKSRSWYYNGTSFIGIRKQYNIRLAWIGPNFTNAQDQFHLSMIMRTTYFTEFSDSDTTWNMNDTRFWKSSIWKKVDMEKRSQ